MEALKSEKPTVLLIDEIDKAPRDFPNDLLHELDKLEFAVPELDIYIEGEPANRPIVFITSNSERRLPEPFLRRCVFHHSLLTGIWHGKLCWRGPRNILLWTNNF